MFSGVLSVGSLPGEFPFCGRRCFSAVSHRQQYSIATRDTVVPMNIEVPTKYPMSHNDRIVIVEIRLHSESPMLYRSALYGNWNALSLSRRALKDKFPMQTIPLTAVLPNRQVFLSNPVVMNGSLTNFVRVNTCMSEVYNFFDLLVRRWCKVVLVTCVRKWNYISWERGLAEDSVSFAGW